MSLRTLSALEARVLAVLVEKESTVPDSYPLSLNALTLGCNQKTAREPVMNASEADALLALEELKAMHLVNTVSGSRVVRFEHNGARGLGVPGAGLALLTLLMLRGPQTTAELRLHTERLHRFADVSSVEGFLEELAEATERRPAFVVKLARAPGAREARWAHLLSGEPAADAGVYAGPPGASAAQDEDIAFLRAEQQRMGKELEQLKALVQRMAAELGMDAGGAI
ncbi:YceH family protein [Paucibacter sp. DJ2R-2]|uniref:YceH family protein n=1 Tax=Paucibacter sp. DJ2R-2 TaxID=2893558 RepID=UPI0021E4F537|nr:YceH family protein [Paucibacter sp. DJ2R-2]MCV2422277.1 YceH family protein [Paucibacter sp. DJ4R-1]MCV2440139.1 YceH family protein [Paucibacter sp. DJ2R-2]